METVISTEGLLVPIVVFGLAPGLLLRLIVLAFSKDDPRREELRAGLDGVPRLERPFWVLEQIEVAIAEGLGARM